MRRAALAGGLAVLALGLAFAALPFLTRDRDLLSTTPQPSPLFELDLLQVPAGSQACLDSVVVDERSQVARVQVGTYGRPGPPLRLTRSGAGYRATGRVAGGAYGDNGIASMPVDPPAAPTLVEVCVHNEGRQRIALFASTDRTRTRSRTRVDGARVFPNFVLSFAERRPGSLLGHIAPALGRMTALRPVGEWLLWPLALLFVVAVPAGILAAYVRAAGSAEDEDAAAAAPPRVPLRERHPRLARLADRPGAWLAAIAAVAFAIAATYTTALVQYFVMPDELGYVKQASHISSTLQPNLPGDMWFNSYAQLWPLVMAPAYGLFDTPTAFDIAHLLAAAALASTAIPAWLLARRVIDGRAGPLFAAALSVAVPWLAFSGSVMTESLAYPVFVWALLACAGAIERPSPQRDALALGAIAVAFLTRPHLGALLVAFVAGVVLHELTFAAGGRRSPRALLRAHALLVAGAAAGVLLVVAGLSASTLFGNYSSATSGSPFVDGMLAEGRELLAHVSLGVAVLPLALAPAWIVLELMRPRHRAAHAVAALALTTLVTMLFVTASFSVRYTAGINDRYLFFIAPLLTIGAVALLFDRRQATLPLAGGAAVAAAVLGTSVLSTTGPSLVSPTYSINTVVQGRGRQIADAVGLGGLSPPDLLAIVTVVAVAALAVARVRRPADARLAIGVCIALLVLSTLGTRYTLNAIKQTQAGASPEFQAGRNWLDVAAPPGESVGAVMAFFQDPSATTVGWWDLSFWNKRLDRVWQLPDTSRYEHGFALQASIDPRTGRIPALDERSLLVRVAQDRRFALRGGRTIAGAGPFELVRAPRPYRAAWWLQAARDDGVVQVGTAARLTLFGDGARARRVRLRLSATANPEARRNYRLIVRGPAGRTWSAPIAVGERATLQATVSVPAVGGTRLSLSLRGGAPPTPDGADEAGVVIDGVATR